MHVVADSWVQVALAALNVVQTIALAYMASRSKRIRQTDRLPRDHVRSTRP